VYYLCIADEEFCPDAKFAYVYWLADERKLSDMECPLLVQLNWGKDDREGRFLLKREIDKTTAVSFKFFILKILSIILLQPASLGQLPILLNTQGQSDCDKPVTSL